MPVETENITEHRSLEKRKTDPASCFRKKEVGALGTFKDSHKHLNTVALRAYSGQRTQSVTNEQIAEFLPMVRKIVHRVITYLKPPLSFEDLVSAGTVGLVKAARDFDPSFNTEFKTYAYTKIKGAVLDELRGWSFVPANLNKQIRSALKLAREITEQTGTPPTDAELADKLGITVDKLYETLESARAQHFTSIDAPGENSPALGELLTAANTTTPVQQIERAELIEKLTETIQQLTKRQKQIILLYYQQHLTMKQIADIFEITEPRISQLHASALFNLSVKLRQWKDGR
jgi:RNA polymerase sigma factor for flagellar operon FliA